MSGTTDVLQASGSLIQAGCALLALGGLFVYTRDTRDIRNSTLNQAKAQQRPFFIFEFGNGEGTSVTLATTNIGSGHAYRFRAFTGSGIRIPGFTRNTVVPTGAKRYLHNDAATDLFLQFALDGGVRLEYEDLAGNRYWSEYKNRKAEPGETSASEHYELSYGEIPRPRK